MEDLTRWNLKLAMVRARVTQFRMAREVGRSQAWLSDVVNGYIEPTPEQRAVFARVLGKDEQELFPQLSEVVPA